MPVCSSREISMNGGRGALEAVFESSEVCLMIIFMKGGGAAPGRYIKLLYRIFFKLSICLSVPCHNNRSRFTVIFRLVFQLSICISVFLSVFCLFPPPDWGGGVRAFYLHKYTDYSFNWQSVHLSVCSSRG